MSDDRAVALAVEAFLDAFLRLADGRDDGDVIFIDGALRQVAVNLGIPADFDEIEPMTVAEFRRRYREGKRSIADAAAGGGTPAPSERET